MQVATADLLRRCVRYSTSRAMSVHCGHLRDMATFARYGRPCNLATCIWPPARYGHLCAIWPPVQSGHLCDMATCAIWPPRRYSHTCNIARIMQINSRSLSARGRPSGCASGTTVQARPHRARIAPQSKHQSNPFLQTGLCLGLAFNPPSLLHPGPPLSVHCPYPRAQVVGLVQLPWGT